MNEQNLTPIRSTEEAREKGAIGGKKSAEARRVKRDLRAAMKELLELPVSDSELWSSISAMGIDPKNINNRAALVVALFAKAARGDVAAFKEVRSLMGEDKDAERLKLQREKVKNSSGDGMLSELLAALKNDDLKE